VLVGDGPVREELVRQSHASGLDGALHFPGLQEDVRPYLSAMDVFMISSQFEGLPIALLEAMAMECGVVSTAVGGIPEVVRSGENGLLVQPADPMALARAVDVLLRDPEGAKRMGHAARETVEGGFGVRRMTQQLEEAYTEVLGNGSHGR
jgi:glycosyltransferase involved in cell wall biosynthesis